MMVDIIESDEQQQQDQEQEEQKEEMWALERLQWPFMNSFFMYSSSGSYVRGSLDKTLNRLLMMETPATCTVKRKHCLYTSTTVL